LLFFVFIVCFGCDDDDDDGPTNTFSISILRNGPKVISSNVSTPRVNAYASHASASRVGSKAVPPDDADEYVAAINAARDDRTDDGNAALWPRSVKARAILCFSSVAVAIVGVDSSLSLLLS